MQSSPDRNRNLATAERGRRSRGQRSPAAVTLSLALLSAGIALPAAAQTAPPASADAIKQREQELEAARTEQKKAAELRQKLQAEIARKLGYKLVDHRLELYCVPLDDDKN